MKKILLSTIFLLSCATAPKPATVTPPVVQSDQDLCEEVMSTACFHLDTCFPERVRAEQCFAQLQPQCQGLTGMDDNLAKKCIGEIIVSSCDQSLPQSCLQLAGEEPQSPQPKTLEL